MRLHIRLPKHLQENPDPCEEAEFYAKCYRRAKTEKQRQRVVESLLVNGSGWDAITRSIHYLYIFEKCVRKNFPGFWK